MEFETEKEFHKRHYEICSFTNKRCYSEKEANIQLSTVRKNYYRGSHKKRVCKKTATGKIPKRKYYCSYCKMYHLTSSSTSSEQEYTKKHKRYIKTENYKNLRNITIDIINI